MNRYHQPTIGCELSCSSNSRDCLFKTSVSVFYGNWLCRRIWTVGAPWTMVMLGSGLAYYWAVPPPVL